MMNEPEHQNVPESRAPNAAEIRDLLRGEIVCGSLKPGERLPTHMAFVERFGVSNVTIQSALNQLVGDGFIEIRPRVGSFVVEQPPNLRHVGLVFPFTPADRGDRWNWSKYYQSLTIAASDIQRETGRRISLFHGVDYHSDSEDRQRLIQYIERRQLAGLIFSGTPYMYQHTPLVDAPGLARVELSSTRRAPWPVINIGSFDWFSMALDRLAQGGRRRVAILYHRLARNELHQVDKLQLLCDKRGMVCPPMWRQAVDWRDALAANHLVQLLFSGAPEARPDALLVVDDNLIEGVVAGLVEAGLRIPSDVEVIARVNHPLPVAPALPLQLLGCDLREVLRHSLDLIDRQLRGVPPPPVTTMPSFWQDDLEATAPTTGRESDTMSSNRNLNDNRTNAVHA